MNDGSEMPRNVMPVSTKSIFEYWRTAEITPSGIPMEIPMTIAGAGEHDGVGRGRG